MQKYKDVPEFMADLDEDNRVQVETVRNIILQADTSLTEHIKWNAPSYVKDGTDRITFNMLNKERLVKLVLHMDTGRKEDKKAPPVMDDPSGLVEWASDIRGYLTFKDAQDIEDKKVQIAKIVKEWLAIAP
jgi:hypothetical protein